MASTSRSSPTAKRCRHSYEDVTSSGSDECSSDSDSSLNPDYTSESDNQCAPTRVRKRTKTVPAREQADIVWNQQDCLPRRFEFSGNPGVATADLDDSSTPLDVFVKFVPDELFDRIADQTNMYAAVNMTVDLDSNSRLWFNTTSDELKALVSLVILMGITTKPDVRAYWSREPMMETPFFASTIPRDRFFQLLNNLHFNKDGEDDGTDQLFKLRPVIDTLTDNFKSVYIPSQNITTDESLLVFQGRLNEKYDPSKRARFGVNVYKTCQSTGDAAGYTWNMNIYTDHDKAGSHSVFELNEDLLDCGYNIFLSNWFSSPDLFLRLRDRQTNVCGSISLGQEQMPPDLTTVKLKRGECVYRSSDGGLLALVWKDKEEVAIILSTMHSASMDKTGRNDKDGKPREKPSCVLDYNRGKSGVDPSNQLATCHRSFGKSIKWYKSLFFYLLDHCLVNSFIVYKLVVEDISYMDFRMALIKEILHDVTLPEYTTRGRPHTQPSPNRLTGRHFPAIIPPTQKTAGPCKRCVVCKAAGRRRETRYVCEVCNVALCLQPCFKTYHTELDY